MDDQKKAVYKPRYTAFSCTLLLWCVFLVVFIAGYIEITGRGWWCKAPNIPTTIRTGLMYNDMNLQADPCTDIYEYSCGGFLKHHNYSSTLLEMQRNAYLSIDRKNLSLFHTFHKDFQLPFTNNITLDDLAMYGVYPGYSVDVLPGLHKNSEYALYIGVPSQELDLDNYQSTTILPSCMPQTLQNLASAHLNDGHQVYIAMTNMCTNSSIVDGVKELQTYFQKSVFEQVLEFFPNAISEAYAQDNAVPGLDTFFNSVQNMVIQYLRTSPLYFSPVDLQKAIEKVQSIGFYIGTGVRSIEDCRYSSTFMCLKEQAGNTLSLIGEPVNKLRVWEMSSSDVNAYYNPLFNHIVVPYAIAQPPLYDPEYNPIMNYAGLGVIVAHEIGHSLDRDGGLKFDRNGLYNPWIDEITRARFNAYENCLDDLYDNAGMNASLNYVSMNENIADQIGVKSVLSNPLFQSTRERFVLFAQTWCKIGGPTYRRGDSTDPHAASILRVNVTLNTFAQFRSEFGCAPINATC